MSLWEQLDGQYARRPNTAAIRSTRIASWISDEAKRIFLDAPQLPHRRAEIWIWILLLFNADCARRVRVCVCLVGHFKQMRCARCQKTDTLLE